MKTRYIMLLSIVATMILASCSQASFLKCDKDAVNVGVKGETGTIALSCDGGVEIIYSPEWVTVELNDTLLTYTVEANKTNVARKDYVIVKSDTLNLAIPFNQCTRASYMFIPKAKVEISKEGKADDIKVLTDGGDVKVDCPEGVTYSYKNGFLSFKSEGNTGQTKTSKAIVTCDDLTQEITIVQTGNICETCHGKGRMKCHICDGEGMTYCPYITCITCGGRGWIKCRTCGGSGK
ncbi:MAG: hypothetical protein II990_05720 [Muribaculaceae bacterium]|nr:hypothetical protein [Muribaculaceae bacterium]